VAAELAPRLFEPFFTTKPEGTGLGLAMSRTIAEAHGGTLSYRANSPEGACFLMRLPID
jgi:signal transduction histidine kinase